MLSVTVISSLLYLQNNYFYKADRDSSSMMREKAFFSLPNCSYFTIQKNLTVSLLQRLMYTTSCAHCDSKMEIDCNCMPIFCNNFFPTSLKTLKKQVCSFVSLKANQVLWRFILLQRITVKPLLFLQTPKRQKKTCRASKHNNEKLILGFSVVVRKQCFQVSDPLLPLTAMHATAAPSACSDERATWGKSRFLASTAL